jgi:quercetin dioxygenase-like cupin family protein
MKKGESVQGHTHNFDHATYCPSGGFLIKRKHPDGREDSRELWAGDLPLLIKAECWHKMTALADGSVYHCIYAHRTAQGEVSQTYTGWGAGGGEPILIEGQNADC